MRTSPTVVIFAMASRSDSVIVDSANQEQPEKKQSGPITSKIIFLWLHS